MNEAMAHHQHSLNYQGDEVVGEPHPILYQGLLIAPVDTDFCRTPVVGCDTGKTFPLILG